MTTKVQAEYNEIYSWPNLYEAYRRAAKGKRSRAAAANFEFYLEDNLIQLQDELATETYTPGEYTHFTIHEPKRRLISAAPFRDRVVHHALCHIIEPAFEQSFMSSEYRKSLHSTSVRILRRGWCRQLK